MKRVFPLLLVVFICLSLTCCTDSGDRIVPSAANVPTTVKASDFDDRTEYDGALLSKTELEGITLLTFTRTDSNGNEIFNALYRGNGDILTAIEYTVSEYGENNSITSKKLYGRCGGELALNLHTEYKYDGQTVTETFYSSAHEIKGTAVTQYADGVAVSAVKYDSNGLITAEIKYADTRTQTEYVYSFGALSERSCSEKSGNTEKITVYSADNAVLREIEYTYDDSGALLTEKLTSPAEDGEAYTTEYSHSGILTSASKVSADGELLQKYEESSENGVDIVRQSVLFTNGKQTGSIKEELNFNSLPSKRYSYDENGTLYEYTLFDYACGLLTKQSVYTYDGGALTLLTETQYSELTGDLLSTSEYKNGDLLSDRTVYAVVDKGLGVTRYSYENGVICGYTVCVYDRNNNELSNTVHDTSGNPVSGTSHAYRANGSLLSEGRVSYTSGVITEGIETTYNEDGSVLSEETLGANGKVVGKLSYTYTNGIKTGMSATGEDSEFLYRETYEYGENGLVSLLHRYSGNDTLLLITGYDYVDGVIYNESTYEYSESGKLTSHTETTYAGGRVSTIHEFNASETPVFSSAYTYTADGKVLVKEYSYTDGVMTKDVDRVFDALGNPLEYTERTGWGELVTSETYTVPVTEKPSETETTTGAETTIGAESTIETTIGAEATEASTADSTQAVSEISTVPEELTAAEQSTQG